MNKSLITNLTTFLITIYGTISPFYSAEIFMAGLFGLSGGLTNWLAIHMLFERVPFLFGSGVIQLRFKDLKEGIKNLIMHEFFSSKSLEKFSSEKNLSANDILEKINYDKIYIKIVEAIKESTLGSMLEMVGGEKALEPLKDPFKKKIKETIDDLINQTFKNNESLSEGFEDNIEFLIDSRLNELSPEQVKTIIKDIIHKHLGWLVVWGGVFGFLIGLLLGILGGIS